MKTTKIFDEIYKKLSHKDFLKMEALGGEIPFYISPYNAKDEVEIVSQVSMLIKKLKSNGIDVLEINLYNLSIDIINSNLGIEEIFEIEKEMDKEEFLDAIQSVLNIHEVFMPKISELVQKSNSQIYFLTGVGLVFPFIRTHNILNNLQNIAKEAPTVCFYPGKYDGKSLNLFGKLQDDNYYRAFNLDKITSL